MSLRIETEDFIEFSEFNNASFQLDDAVKHAREIVEGIWQEQGLDTETFDSSKWRFINKHQTFTYFEFGDVSDIIRFHDHIEYDDFLLVTKCWVATNLAEFTPFTVRYSFNRLTNFLTLSQSFLNDEEKVDSIKKALMVLGKNARYYTSVYMLNFIQYYEEIDPDGWYGQMLREVKDTVPYTELDTVRILPSTKDLILFHTILNDYFDNLPEGHPAYFKFFPIALWWRLTTVIPLRPFEFCAIPRNTLSQKEDGKYSIYLPRSTLKGNKNRNNVQIINEIPITDEMYEFIKTYIEKTEKYGETETLISYKSIESLQASASNKFNKNHFTYTVLYSLLEAFYREVIINKYELTVNPKKKVNLNSSSGNKKFKELLNKVINSEDENYQIRRKVSLGDTRHLALLNMQRLGYHPVEMARLAGHSNMHTQSAYHAHQQMWVDTEILKLMGKFRLTKKYGTSATQKAFIGHEIKEQFGMSSEWRDKFVLRSSPSIKTVTKKKLELGYCTDEKQRCPVNDCAAGCDYWRIEIDEYNEKKDYIQAKITIEQNRLEYLLRALTDLHKYAISHNDNPEVSIDNLQFNQKLLQKSAEIDEAVYKIAELKTIGERKVTYNE